jgi:hypothetical protein
MKRTERRSGLPVTRRSIISAVVGLAAIVGNADAANAGYADGKLPDGTYHCEVYLLGRFLNLGDISIKGNVYSEPRLLGPPGQGYNYQMDAMGEITWLGPLGGYNSGGNTISLTQATLDEGQAPAFDIIMRQADGAFTASTCTRRT